MARTVIAFLNAETVKAGKVAMHRFIPYPHPLVGMREALQCTHLIWIFLQWSTFHTLFHFKYATAQSIYTSLSIVHWPFSLRMHALQRYYRHRSTLRYYG